MPFTPDKQSTYNSSGYSTPGFQSDRTPGFVPDTEITPTTNSNYTPLGTSLLGGAVSGLAKTGFGIAKSVGNLSDKLTRIPRDLIGGKSLSESWNRPTYLDQAQSFVEQKKGVTPGTLLQPSNLTEKVFKTGGDIAMFFAPAGLEKKATGAVDLALNTQKLVSTFGPKLAPIVSNIVKVATSGAVSGTSMAGVTALEGGTGDEVKTSAKWGSIAGALGRVIGLTAEPLIKKIANSSFKLTPSNESKAKKMIDNATQFVSKNNLSVNPATQYKQADKIVGSFENALQSSLPKNIGVSPETLIEQIRKIPQQFIDDPAIYEEVVRDAENAVITIQKTQKYNVGVESLLKGKRSYGTSAFGKSSAAKFTGVGSEGAYAIEKAYENVLEDTLNKTTGKIKLPQELQPFFNGAKEVALDVFNKVYSQAITVKKFSNLAQFKSDTHLIGRLFGLWVGESVGTAIGGPGLLPRLLGATGGELLSNKLPQIGRSISNTVLRKAPSLIPDLTKIGVGTFNK